MYIYLVQDIIDPDLFPLIVNDADYITRKITDIDNRTTRLQSIHGPNPYDVCYAKHDYNNNKIISITTARGTEIQVVEKRLYRTKR